MRFFVATMWLLPLFFAFSTAQRGFNPFGRIPDPVQAAVNTFNSFTNSIPKVDAQSYGDFLAQTGKDLVDSAREAIFLDHKKLVENVNAGSSGFKCVLNAFSDLTKLEFLQRLTGNKKSASGESKASANRQEAVPPTTKVPNAVDWRQKGGVTPVKYQGECGSCWAFATTGAIEGHIFRSTGKLPVLSEQNLIDCGTVDFGLAGCDGGYQEYAFAFIKDEQKGLAPGGSYPYLDKKDTCKYSPASKAAEVKGFAAIKPKDEKTMKEIVGTLGPLACSVNALETLLLYKEGIYDDAECNKGEVNHAVLVVGYGSEKGKDYWIVKNSWDKNWGEDGYFRLPRGSNFCGIAEECSYPLV
ncbi:cathepsin L1 [Ceratitis capitata]|uniref:cathepsin L1 n=1 Tax=Ceratitis capitata TaxID=7213 RepID=UPI000329C9C3|nr:cathepsin L1 [Ceratitis capitata]